MLSALLRFHFIKSSICHYHLFNYMAFQVKFQHQRFYISSAILILSSVLIQPNMHLVEEEYAPSAWKFTTNPDIFIDFVVKKKAMGQESLSLCKHEKRSWTDFNVASKIPKLDHKSLSPFSKMGGIDWESVP